MDTLRCGVVGLGRGRLFVEKLNALTDCEVVAVCDSKPAALDAFSGLACYTDYSQLIAEADLDVVAIISPGLEQPLQVHDGLGKWWELVLAHRVRGLSARVEGPPQPCCR